MGWGCALIEEGVAGWEGPRTIDHPGADHVLAFSNNLINVFGFLQNMMGYS